MGDAEDARVSRFEGLGTARREKLEGGDSAIPTHAQTEEHLFEVGTTVFAMPVGRSRRSWSLGGVRIHSIERNGRGVLMQPGRRDGIHL
jgi:hypothetical protein